MNGWLLLLSFLLGAAIMWFSIVRRVEVEVVDDDADLDSDPADDTRAVERETIAVGAGSPRAAGRPGAGGRPVVAPPTVDDDFFADDADVYGPDGPTEPRVRRSGPVGD